ARAVGMSEFRIAVRHVLPNTIAPLIVIATAQLGAAILTEASLSFLGLGVPEPHPSWGRMLSESAAEYVRTAPWLVIFPGFASSLVAVAPNLSGAALRHLPAPRAREWRNGSPRRQTRNGDGRAVARGRGPAHLFRLARRDSESGRWDQLYARAT